MYCYNTYNIVSFSTIEPAMLSAYTRCHKTRYHAMPLSEVTANYNQVRPDLSQALAYRAYEGTAQKEDNAGFDYIQSRFTTISRYLVPPAN